MSSIDKINCNINPSPKKATKLNESNLHWKSTLIKKCPQPHEVKTSRVRRCLFPDSATTHHETGSSSNNKEISFKTLSKIYRKDFERVPSKSNEFERAPSKSEKIEFFAIRDQLLEIEKLLERDDQMRVQRCATHSRIERLLFSTLSYEKKMSELGLILFYLDRDGTIPPDDSLFEYRAKQLEQEAASYLQIHRDASNNPLIPSGTTHYLMRAFSHMIFTSNQVYNKGGLIALKCLLNDPSVEISIRLQPEHRQHILTVVDQILKNSAFDELFKRTMTVHPDLEELIRIDLKLSPTANITSVLILYDCMMALFSDVRQNNPNCYAIAALIYATENYAYKTLSQILAWLKEGHYACNTGTTIPIRPLLDKRLLYPQDLAQQLDSKRAETLIPMRQISETLDLQHISSFKRINPPLNQTLSTMLRINNAHTLIPYAEKLYYSYKYNTLIHMQLALYEFVNVNINHTSLESSNGYYPTFKKQFIYTCLQYLENQIQKDHPITTFRTLLKHKLEQRLWCENVFDSCLQSNENTNIEIFQPDHQGNGRDLAKIFEKSLRFFCLNADSYTLLPRISDLQKVIVTSIDEISYNDANLAQMFKSAVYTQGFRMCISHFLSHHIKQEDSEELQVSAEDLNSADVLITHIVGGYAPVILELIYNISMASQSIAEFATAYQLLAKIVENLKIIDTELFRSTSKVLFNMSGHDWTLSHYYWKVLLDHCHAFHPFIQDAIYNPAKTKLASEIPKEIQERIIQRYSSNEITRESVRTVFAAETALTYAGVRDWLLRNIIENKSHSDVGQIIEEEYSKIYLTLDILIKIMQNLNIDSSHNVAEKIFSKHIVQPLLPYQLAVDLRDVFIREHLSIKEPFEIEIAINQAVGLPIPIYLGDLNWQNMYREDPLHQHLIIAFSWALGDLNYFIRQGVTCTVIKTENLLRQIENHFMIFHPTTLNRSQK